MTVPTTLRPAYHFTPPSMWMNDPNGLVYADGEYHLFYQHHPESMVWGPMHWGHAVSTDLVHWEHLPIALYPDRHGMIFSGSAVVDWQNTAGFGAGALVAIFTHHLDGLQRQSLAYSSDSGRTWVSYANNPVLDPPAGIHDFRDPKVFWDAEHGGRWVMSLAVGDHIRFYTSTNLKTWQLSGSFGAGYGSHGGVWETPDLFKLPVEGTDESRWVLSLGIGSGGPAGGSATHYFIGDFDGSTFHSESPPSTVLWADYGADFYAPQSWSDEPDGRRIWVAWMSNWDYARETPTSEWRGACSIPRLLSLVRTPEGVRLCQQPIPEVEQLRRDSWYFPRQQITPETNLLADLSLATAEIIAEFEITPETSDLGIRVLVGDGEQTTIGYTVAHHHVYLDRTLAGDVSFHPAFASRHSAELVPSAGHIRLHVFVDRTSVEVFANDGLVSLTDLVFPTEASTRLELFVVGGAILHALEVYALM